MDFSVIKFAVAKQFANMVKSGHLFVTDTDKDKIWDKYLGSFPEGTNPMFRERTEHDCTCCKQFIRAVGNVVTIIDNKLVSIWDVKVPEEPGYQAVADTLSKYVKSKKINNVFLHDMPTAGTDKNFENLENGGVREWTHFFVNIPAEYVCRDMGSKLADYRSTFDVFYRGLNELTVEACETVIDLSAQNSLPRGAEFSPTVSAFLAKKKEFDKLKTEKEKTFFAWNYVAAKNTKLNVSRIRNSAIGTLLIDLSDNDTVSDEKSLIDAITVYGKKVSGENYQRPNAVYTERQKNEAAKKVEELGLTSALSRRRAVMADVGVNNVLYADRNVRPKMADSPFDEIPSSTVSKKKPKSLDGVTEVTIEKFINEIIPTASCIEAYLENTHAKNMVSLIAPVDPTAGRLFNWDNNFSWAYSGGYADSVIKQRVKNAGGNVDAEVCCRLAWNNTDDLDLHLVEPGGQHIYFGSYRGHKTNFGGMLDVDMNAGGNLTTSPVENIFYGDTKKMKTGKYKLYVNQYRLRNKSDFGFEVEIQIRGEIYSFSYDKIQKRGENVVVAEIYYDSETDTFTVDGKIAGQAASKDVWNLKTNEWYKVSLAMLSPNYWDGQKAGNKHYMFILDGCSNPEPARGFFNEFLRGDLKEHRRVFEALGSKMLCNSAVDELSGVGFPSTQHAEMLFKVSGSFNRIVKVVF